MVKRISVLFVAAGFATIASAQQIGTRAQLNTILGGGGTTDNFETYTGLGSGAVNLGITHLDSTTVVNGQGPGLVNSGASYDSVGNNGLQWNGAGYFGQTSQDFLSNNQTLKITYSGFVQAMGVDLSTFAGYGDTFTITVYNAAGAQLGQVQIVDSGTSGMSEFFGWQSSGGIASVTFSDAVHGWSPIIDNHTYGAVPEPASMLALALGAVGLVARRRKNRA